jgi:quinol monooxygenase YgiN
MVVFLINHHVKPEFVVDYQLAVREDVRNSILEDGILRFEVYQDIQNTAHFTLLEVYKNMDARESHLKTPHLLQFRKIVKEGGMLAKSESNEVRLLSDNDVIKYPLK